MPHDDRSSGEIRVSWLVPCHDENGNRINVGAAATRGGQVALIGPPSGTAVLTPEQTAEYQDKIRAALLAAAQPRPSGR